MLGLSGWPKVRMGDQVLTVARFVVPFVARLKEPTGKVAYEVDGGTCAGGGLISMTRE